MAGVPSMRFIGGQPSLVILRLGRKSFELEVQPGQDIIALIRDSFGSFRWSPDNEAQNLLCQGVERGLLGIRLFTSKIERRGSARERPTNEMLDTEVQQLPRELFLGICCGYHTCERLATPRSSLCDTHAHDRQRRAPHPRMRPQAMEALSLSSLDERGIPPFPLGPLGPLGPLNNTELPLMTPEDVSSELEQPMGAHAPPASMHGHPLPLPAETRFNWNTPALPMEPNAFDHMALPTNFQLGESVQHFSSVAQNPPPPPVSQSLLMLPALPPLPPPSPPSSLAPAPALLVFEADEAPGDQFPLPPDDVDLGDVLDTLGAASKGNTKSHTFSPPAPGSA